MYRYGKSYHGRNYRHKLPPLAIVAIVAGIVLVLAIVVGNILNHVLDDETYKKLTTGSEKEQESDTPNRTSPQVRAYSFRLGNSTRSLGSDPPNALSVPLSTADGKLYYKSQVAEYLGFDTVESPNTTPQKSMENLTGVVSYLVGTWHPNLPDGEDDAVYTALAKRDSAVLEEFLSYGGREILLVGMDFGDKNFESTYLYLTKLQLLLGDSVTLSVSVTLATAEGDGGWDILYALGQKLPFLTLDLTNEDDIGIDTETETASDSAEQSPMVRANYYLSSYGMRLLLSSEQKNLLSTAEETVSDFLVLYAD